MKSTFVIIRSFLFVFTVYVSFILNNSFAQYFTSQTLLSTFLLTFILADLMSFGYKVVYSNAPGFKLFVLCSAIALLLLIDIPALLNYFIIMTAILLYIYSISFLANFFSLEDQLSDYSLHTVRNNKYFTFHERKGLLFSTYFIKYNHPLVFLSTDDAQHFIDFLRTSQGFTTLSYSSDCFFILSAQGFRYSHSTLINLYQSAIDLEKIVLNLLIK